jgi:signal peptidase I
LKRSVAESAAVPPPAPLVHALQATLRTVLVALFVVTFLVQPDRIPSGSMWPTLKIGDFFLVNKLAFVHGLRLLPPRVVERGDIIVFRLPVDPARLLVKRVVAVPGDRLRLREGHVMINGARVAEPYAEFTAKTPDVYRDDFPALHASDPEIDPAWWAELHRDTRAKDLKQRDLQQAEMQQAELTVPARSYFVLGDNRDNSDDSRYWGFVPAAAIEGTAVAVYYSQVQGSGAEAGRGSEWRRLTAGFHAARVLR